jgi:hypothetical protein
MSNKPYKITETESEPMIVKEPAVAYRQMTDSMFSSDGWKPNIPFHGTQEDWWEHFHQIEEEDFTPLEEANREFEAWEKEYQDKGIVAYTTSGKPLSQEQYIEKIEKAIVEADRNELITDDDLEKEIATW